MNIKALFRLPIVLLVGVSIAFSLIYLMQILIDNGISGKEEVESYKLGDVVMPPEQQKQVDVLDLPDYQEVLTPPPPDQSKPPPAADDSAVGLSAAIGETSTEGFELSLGGGPRDSEMIPILRSAPVYPQRALTRGIQGWVLLEFSVDEEGRVLNPRVITSEPSSIFNSAALRAIGKWRYRPRVIDGQAVIVDGQQFRMVFELEN